MDKKKIIDAVRAHALAHYDCHGWGYVVECYDDYAILDDMGDAKTAEEAIARVGKICKARDARRAEYEAEAYTPW